MMGRTFYRSLDGIRGMAVIFVVVSHLSNLFHFGFDGTGKLGVWAFFILSSFLLSSYFISAPDKITDSLEWVNYFVRRFMRIFPLYVLILLFDLNFTNVITKDNIWQHLTLMNGLGHYWTIPVEMTFYVILPVIVFLISKVFSNNLWLTIGFFSAVIVGHQFLFPANASTINDYHLRTYFPVFVIGCIASLVHEKMRHMIFSGVVKKWYDVGAAMILITILLTTPSVWSKMFYPIPSSYFHKDFILFALLWAVFILFVLHGNGFIRMIFEWKPIRLVGKISYSIYLIHLFVIFYFMRHYGVNAVTIIPMIVSIIAIPYITYRCIERPCMKITIMKKKTNDIVTNAQKI